MVFLSSCCFRRLGWKEYEFSEDLAAYMEYVEYKPTIRGTCRWLATLNQYWWVRVFDFCMFLTLILVLYGLQVLTVFEYKNTGLIPFLLFSTSLFIFVVLFLLFYGFGMGYNTGKFFWAQPNDQEGGIGETEIMA